MSDKNQNDNHNSDDWWYYDNSRMKRSMYESDPTLDPDYEKIEKWMPGSLVKDLKKKDLL